MPSRPTERNTPYAERGAVVSSHDQSVGLTRAGIPATTFGDVLAQPDPATSGYFGADPAVLFVTPATAGVAEAVADRLEGLAVPFRVVRELLDGGRK